MFSLSEWQADAEAGRAQIWLVWSDKDTCQGAGLTHLMNTPMGKVCVITAFGADRGVDWGAHLVTVEQWAASQECSKVRVYGRVGWVEKLKGYALKGAILDRNLKDVGR